jgi:hypothetical protein
MLRHDGNLHYLYTLQQVINMNVLFVIFIFTDSQNIHMDSEISLLVLKYYCVDLFL